MEKLPQRKNLRLPKKDYSSIGGYFITICTYRKQPLFGRIGINPFGEIDLLSYEHQADNMIQKWLNKINENFPKIVLDTHIIMPDHLHIILQIHDPANTTAIPTVVEWFKTMTTNEYIRLVKDGLYPPFHKAVWQRGYYEHIIRNIDDLSEIRNYIIRNPLICYFRHLPKPTQGGFHES